MATIVYRSVKGTPLTNTEIDDNFTNLDTEVGLKLNSADYTANDVLNKIKTVDGSGSGLDADLLDGLNPVSGATGASIVSRDSSGNFAANQITAAQLIGPLYLGTTDTIVFEGSTDNAYETILTVTNPTADRTITLPNVTGTVVTTGDTGTVTNAMLAGTITNAKLENSSISIDGNSVSLGGSVSIASGTITWTGSQTFIDNKFAVIDNIDSTKVLNLQLSNITTGTTRTLTIPNETGTIATQSYVQTYTVPVGGIIMWSGTVATIPANWALCNGSNGTPDLRNRFIVGAYSDTAGTAYSTITGVNTQTGGTKDAVLLSHNHTITDPGHFHNYGGSRQVQAGADNSGPFVNGSGTTTNTASNTTGISLAAAGTSDGSNQNLPPYFALAFIMRIS